MFGVLGGGDVGQLVGCCFIVGAFDWGSINGAWHLDGPVSGRGISMASERWGCVEELLFDELELLTGVHRHQLILTETWS